MLTIAMYCKIYETKESWHITIYFLTWNNWSCKKPSWLKNEKTKIEQVSLHNFSKNYDLRFYKYMGVKRPKTMVFTKFK